MIKLHLTNQDKKKGNRNFAIPLDCFGSGARILTWDLRDGYPKILSADIIQWVGAEENDLSTGHPGPLCAGRSHPYRDTTPRRRLQDN